MPRTWPHTSSPTTPQQSLKLRISAAQANLASRAADGALVFALPGVFESGEVFVHDRGDVGGVSAHQGGQRCGVDVEGEVWGFQPIGGQQFPCRPKSSGQ